MRLARITFACGSFVSQWRVAAPAFEPGGYFGNGYTPPAPPPPRARAPASIIAALGSYMAQRFVRGPGFIIIFYSR